MKAKRLLSKGCQGYLAHVVLNDDAPSSAEDVRVVRYFLNVFPEDLPELPPDRDVEFVIDLLPGIQVDSQKVAAVENWEQPRTVIELKYYLTHAPVLALLDDSGNCEVYIDAYLNGIKANPWPEVCQQGRRAPKGGGLLHPTSSRGVILKCIFPSLPSTRPFGSSMTSSSVETPKLSKKVARALS
ncbi:hypothetical protein TB1_033841 [Malus domestica]